MKNRNEKEFQHNYYLAHRDKLRKRHLAYALAVRLGKRVPKPRKNKKRVCWFCKDFIFGKLHEFNFGGRNVVADSGCYQWVREGNFYKI